MFSSWPWRRWKNYMNQWEDTMGDSRSTFWKNENQHFHWETFMVKLDQSKIRNKPPEVPVMRAGSRYITWKVFCHSRAILVVSKASQCCNTIFVYQLFMNSHWAILWPIRWLDQWDTHFMCDHLLLDPWTDFETLGVYRVDRILRFPVSTSNRKWAVFQKPEVENIGTGSHKYIRGKEKTIL